VCFSRREARRGGLTWRVLLEASAAERGDWRLALVSGHATPHGWRLFGLFRAKTRQHWRLHGMAERHNAPASRQSGAAPTPEFGAKRQATNSADADSNSTRQAIRSDARKRLASRHAPDAGDSPFGVGARAAPARQLGSRTYAIVRITSTSASRSSSVRPMNRTPMPGFGLSPPSLTWFTQVTSPFNLNGS